MIQTESKLRHIALMGLLLALTLMIQMMGLPQPVTGPAVNAILYLSAGLLGWRQAAVIGLLTPLAALLRGQLPPVLAPMLPFIMAGNAILVLSYAGVIRFLSLGTERLRMILALAYSAVIKWLWLWMAASWALPVVLGKSLPPAALAAMALPQLLTALAGGAVAFMAFKILKNRVF